MRFFIILIIFLTSISGWTQREFGLAMVKELCSEKYHGRGYVKEGHKKAASFIASEFKNYGVQSFPDHEDYMQEFEMPINAFPDTINLSINDKELQVGIDFIVDPISGSANGQFTPVFIDSPKELFAFEYAKKEERLNKVIVIRDPESKSIDTNGLYNELKHKSSQLAPVIWLTNKKLTWSVGRIEAKYPIIEVVDSNVHQRIANIEMHINNRFDEHLVSQNVVGFIPGKNSKKTIAVTAHYDHLGRMGDAAYFPGANDNASGTAMMLYLAQHYSKEKPDYNMLFIAFSGEEVGLLGSRHFVINPLVPLDEIKFLINLDILGTGEDGITVVNGAVFTKELKKLTKINNKEGYLKKIKMRGKAANSDHYYFTQAGVPAFFIYTMGGVSYYHDVLDKADTLPLNEFDDLANLLIKFICKL